MLIIGRFLCLDRMCELTKGEDDTQTENESDSTAEILWGLLLGFVVSAPPLVYVGWSGVMECSLLLVATTGTVGLPDKHWYISRTLVLFGLAMFAAGAFFDSTALLAGAVISLSAAVTAQRDNE